MERRTPLGRGKPLDPGTKPLDPGTKGLDPGKGLARVTPIHSKPRGPRRPRERGDHNQPAPIGSPVSPMRYDMVCARDWDMCVRCGVLVGPGFRQCQHRVPRGMGGRKGHDNYSHLVLLCGTSATDPDGCHFWAERYRTEAQACGLLVPDGQDPTTWPVVYSEMHGGGLWLLDDEGDRRHVGEA